jgi:hypothetical protein
MDGSPSPLLFEQTVILCDAGDLPASRGQRGTSTGVSLAPGWASIAGGVEGRPQMS